MPLEKGFSDRPGFFGPLGSTDAAVRPTGLAREPALAPLTEEETTGPFSTSVARIATRMLWCHQLLTLSPLGYGTIPRQIVSFGYL